MRLGLGLERQACCDGFRATTDSDASAEATAGGLLGAFGVCFVASAASASSLEAPGRGRRRRRQRLRQRRVRRGADQSRAAELSAELRASALARSARARYRLASESWNLKPLPLGSAREARMRKALQGRAKACCGAAHEVSQDRCHSYSIAAAPAWIARSGLGLVAS